MGFRVHVQLSLIGVDSYIRDPAKKFQQFFTICEGLFNLLSRGQLAMYHLGL